MILILVVIALTIFLLRSARNRPESNVPLVENCYPIIGHVIAFNRDIMSFVKKNCAKYGPIFKVKICLKTLIVVCDRTLLKDYFRASEAELSLYRVLKALYFGDAFSDDPNMFDDMIKLIRKSITLRAQEFIPKIMAEARTMIKSIKPGQPFDLIGESIKFVANTSSYCFIGQRLSDGEFTTLMDFTHFLNRIVVLTYFMPLRLIKAIFGRKIREYRKTMVAFHRPIVMQYIEDRSLTTSQIIRNCVDHFYYRGYTDEQICETTSNILLCLLYVSSENTALGLANTIYDLCRNSIQMRELELQRALKTQRALESQDHLDHLNDQSGQSDSEDKSSEDLTADPIDWYAKVGAITSKYLSESDYGSMFADEDLDNVVMESARIGTHIFPLNRMPVATEYLGDYFVGDADVIAIAEPMLMMDPLVASDVYADPATWNPNRFKEIYRGEQQKKGPQNVMTWGSGIHACPGKIFAQYEIKACVALFTNHFTDPEFVEVSPMNYFSPSAYGERKVIMKIRASGLGDLGHQAAQAARQIALPDGRNLPVLETTHNGTPAYLIRNVFDSDGQFHAYRCIYELSIGSDEQEVLEAGALVNPFYPLTFDNLVYTGTGNCRDNPTTVYKHAQMLWNALREQVNPDLPELEFSSLYSQLFTGRTSNSDANDLSSLNSDAKQAIMKDHLDEHVDWGISYSLGASCMFSLGDSVIALHSGDVLITDFSKILHGVRSIQEFTMPDWFSDASYASDPRLDDPDELPRPRTFGCKRCSVQIRSVAKHLNMSMDQFKAMLGA
jgi:cytochrome P450